MICATRVHCKSASCLPSIEKIFEFINENSQIAEKILICLGVGDKLEYVSYYQEIIQRVESENISDVVIVQPVCPWGTFTHPLNVAIRIALERGFDRILFQSLEVSMNSMDKDRLLSHFDEDKTLVVGPVLEGHSFVEGVNPLRGRTTPWNTCAIWSVKKLALVGFPMIGDGIPNELPGGVEEVSAIALAQTINSEWEAKLIQLQQQQGENSEGGPQWATVFQDEERKKYHEEKMKSKDTRPANQMVLLQPGINEGTVMHIRHSPSAFC